VPNLVDLIKQGLVKEGEELIWKRRVQGVTHKAIVVSNGKIRTQDGNVHKTPSGAAKHLNAGRPVDGWLAWKTQRGFTLSDLRRKLNV